MILKVKRVIPSVHLKTEMCQYKNNLNFVSSWKMYVSILKVQIGLGDVGKNPGVGVGVNIIVSCIKVPLVLISSLKFENLAKKKWDSTQRSLGYKSSALPSELWSPVMGLIPVNQYICYSGCYSEIRSHITLLPCNRGSHPISLIPPGKRQGRDLKTQPFQIILNI